MKETKFFPYPMYWDDAPLDLSFIYGDEKPAGKHGFMQCEGDRFIFEDGTPAIFWGSNFNSGACFPPKDKAQSIAKRLAKFGVNIVRFHQMDAHWANPNIFQLSKGQRRDTQSLDPEVLDRLDYFIYCLKQEGIYIYMDLLTYRRAKDIDGMESTYDLYDGMKSISYFNRRMIQLQKKFNYDLFSHFNPYTDLEYRNDPVIVMAEITNEDDLFAREVKIEPYYSELLDMYKKWCQVNERQVEQEPIRFTAAFSRQVTDFMMQVQEEYFQEMIDHLRNMGVKIPITGTNWNTGVHNRCSHLVTDFCDNHNYYVIWEWKEHTKRFISTPMFCEHDAFIAPLSFSRQFGYPFFVSEWDVPWPNHYRAQSSIFLAAVSAFQGWMGCAIHTYRYDSRVEYTPYLGKEISSSAIGNTPYREGMFATYNDPAKFGLFYAAAAMLRRGDVQMAKQSVEVELLDEDIQVNMHDKLHIMPAMYGLGEKHQLGVKLPYMDIQQADRVIAKDDVQVASSDGEVLSDTGELYRSWKKGYGWVDSPRSKAVYGFIQKNGPVVLHDVTVQCENEFATIVLTSLTDAPIAQSDNILLTTVGRAENSDMRFNEEGNEMLDLGKPPIMAEVIEATISIQTSCKNLKVWSVNPEGFLTGTVDAIYEDGKLTISTGKVWPSIYYLIQAE